MTELNWLGTTTQASGLLRWNGVPLKNKVRVRQTNVSKKLLAAQNGNELSLVVKAYPEVVTCIIH